MAVVPRSLYQQPALIQSSRGPNIWRITTKRRIRSQIRLVKLTLTAVLPPFLLQPSQATMESTTHFPSEPPTWQRGDTKMMKVLNVNSSDALYVLGMSTVHVSDWKSPVRSNPTNENKAVELTEAQRIFLFIG